MYDTPKRIKALWKATGKLIAAYYNQQHYGGQPTIAVVIHQVHEWYQGEHIPHAPFETGLRLSMEQQAAALAYYSYGSVVLAIQQSEPLHYHFNPIQGSGRSDFLDAIDYLKVIGITSANLTSVVDCINNHVTNHRWQPEFKELFELPISNLIRMDLESFPIDHLWHISRIMPFLKKHEPAYNGYVSSLQQFMQHALTVTQAPTFKNKIR